MDYNKQAVEFLEKHNATIEIKYLKTDKYFPDDKEKRDIYDVTIKRNRNGRKLDYNFTFGDSIHNTRQNQLLIRDIASGRMLPTGRRKQKVTPSEYDVLAALTKYEVGQFDDFIYEFGYTFNSEREYIKVKQIHFNVLDEYNNVLRLFGDCMEELQEIQ